MIIWLTGNSGSGKTTLARRLAGPNRIILDGDEMRASISCDLDLSEEGRAEQNLRVARLAKVLEGQGFDVVVAVICPYGWLRRLVLDVCGCVFLYLPGGETGDDYPYEIPLEEEAVRVTGWEELIHGELNIS